VASVFNAIGQSPSWNSTVVILTYDDWGGWFDEVKPPVQFNAFEPGFRIPFVAVSPYAKRGYVSHQVHFIGSILHFVESTFGLGSLGTSDAHSDALDDVFDYAQTPLPYVPVTPLPAPTQAAGSLDTVPPGLDPD
jgi:phospholipase C